MRFTTSVLALTDDVARLRSRALSSSFFLSCEDFIRYVQIEFIKRVRLSFSVGEFGLGGLFKMLVFESEELSGFEQYGESICMRLTLRFECVIMLFCSACVDDMRVWSSVLYLLRLSISLSHSVE